MMAAVCSRHFGFEKKQKPYPFDQRRSDAFAKSGVSETFDTIAEEVVEDSPYEDVRAAVRPVDDREAANTIRAWILGFVFVTIGSGLNMFLSLRSPAISFPSIVIQLVVFPIGCLWAKVVSTKVFNTFGVRWAFNTGPFSIKEHSVITLMSNVSVGNAYSTNALLALQGKPFYNTNMGWGFQLLFTFSSQLIGVALAGICRRFLVWPPSMIWPGQFANISLFYALHDRRSSSPDKTNGWIISRYRWFIYVMLASFAWYWIPGVLWQGLSVFAFITWIKPNNAALNQLFGGFTGLSLIPITLDWTYVSAYLQDPLLAPVHALVNTLMGLTIFVIITTIAISYTGTWYSDYLPINTSSLFDNRQGYYNVSKVLGPNFTFDLYKYENYSPVFLAPTFALNYGLSFAALTAAVVHIIIFHGTEIWHRIRVDRNRESDVHMRMILKYPDAPDWWYGTLFIVSMSLGLATVLAYPSQLPWWAFLISNFISFIFIIPTCMIYATTNIPLDLNALAPFLAGFIIPGRPIGVMIFKVFSATVVGQAQNFSGDLKMAHYMKIPPKTTFSCQIAAIVWGCCVQIAVLNWTLANVQDICETAQSAHFTCPYGHVFFSSSIVWGVIGPHRMLGPGSIYSAINYYWLLGPILPCLFYILSKRFPLSSKLRLLNAPVMLGAMTWIPPATPLSFSSWALVGLLFNYYIRRRWTGWWHTYNYITAAALDSGLIVATIVVFFVITLPGVSVPKWWGNTTVFETLDFQNRAIRKMVGEGEVFGK